MKIYQSCKYYLAVLAFLVACSPKKPQIRSFDLGLSSQIPIDTSLTLASDDDDLRIWLDSAVAQKPLDYQLEGFDADTLPLLSRCIRYTNLAGGLYTLRVWEKGQMQTELASVRLDVQHELFEETWFTPLLLLNIGLITALLALIWLFYDRRQNKILAQVRNEFVRNLHDETLGGLANVTSLVKIAKKKQDLAFTSKSLETIQSITEQSTDFLRTGIHALNPKQNTIGHLLDKMQKNYQSALSGAQMQLSWNEPDQKHYQSLRGTSISLKQYWQFSLMFRELLNNIIKHANADQVVVDIHPIQKELVVRIKDNGVGFDLDHQKGGYGLESLTERARLAHSTLEIKTAPGAGTEVSFTIPPL